MGSLETFITVKSLGAEQQALRATFHYKTAEATHILFDADMKASGLTRAIHSSYHFPSRSKLPCSSTSPLGAPFVPEVHRPDRARNGSATGSGEEPFSRPIRARGVSDSTVFAPHRSAIHFGFARAN